MKSQAKSWLIRKIAKYTVKLLCKFTALDVEVLKLQARVCECFCDVYMYVYALLKIDKNRLSLY